MDPPVFIHDVDPSNSVETPDLDNILQIWAREDHMNPPWQRSSTLTQSDEVTSSIDPYGSPCLALPSHHAEELQQHCFNAGSLESFPKDDQQVHLTSFSSSLLDLQRELLGPFLSDFSTNSISGYENILLPEECISVHDTETSSSFGSNKSSLPQQLLLPSSDNIVVKQKMNRLQPQPDLSSLNLASPHLPGFSGHEYSFPLDLENSGTFGSSNFELLFAGDVEGSVAADTGPISSSSSSSREEAIMHEDFNPHPANSHDDHKTLVSGSKVTDQQTNPAHDILMKNKSARKGRKRVREARYAIQTKSEKVVLEDGYKWRKYGQKAVKNSPHPRSYYRCTFDKCCVKKTVERSYVDSGIVITTYEGVHIHPSPAAIRTPTDAFLFQGVHAPPFSKQLYLNVPHLIENVNYTSNLTRSSYTSSRRSCCFESSAQLRGVIDHQLDNGLLEDMLPSAQVHRDRN